MSPTTYIHDRESAQIAIGLIASHGALARNEAQLRAKASRNNGNVITFCRWRQIGRLIEELDCATGSALLH